MKTLYRLITLSLFVFLISSATAGQGYEKEKTIKKEFSVNSDAELNVENKYGGIHCNIWDKNIVSIEVYIKVEASSEKKAQRVFEQIDIEINGSSSEVRAETNFSDGWSNESGELDISINYKIFMPKTLKVTLDNNFGDVFIEETSGNTEISVGYGSFIAKKLLGDENILDISFSSAVIDLMKNTDIEIKHSSLNLTEVSELSLESKHSGLVIDKADYAEIESQYDDITIGEISSLDIECKFSELKISKLTKSLILDNEYGGAKIKYIKPGFEEVIINSSFGGVVMGIDEDASYSIEAVMEFGDLSYPDNNASIIKEVEGYTTNKYKGTIGENKNSSSKIVIETTNAGVSIKSW